MNKVSADAAEAVADITDGASLAVGGFGLSGVPEVLVRALYAQGADGLKVVSNNCGVDGRGLGVLLAAGRIARVTGSYVGENKEFARQYLSGELEVELVPQGTLAERLRAAGAGIPAFYTPTAVGTELAEGRETRVINGREYLLEYALPCDVAFIRAWRADTAGNVQFRLAQRNFCPLMAMAAKLTIVEVEEDILPAGALDPDQVHLSGIFVQRLVKVPPAPEGLWTVRRQERAK